MSLFDCWMISDAGLMYLEPFAALQRLDLKQTRVSERGVERLRARLPNCEINH